MTFKRTKKQVEIMRLVLEAADEGRPMLLKELRAKLPWGMEVNHQSVICSLDFLRDHGFLTKDNTGKRRAMEIKPTAKAYKEFRGDPILL